MATFICQNGNCDKLLEEVIIPKLRLVFNKSTQELEPSEPIICVSCGESLIQVKNEHMPIIFYNEFDSLSSAQKKEVIHKRSMKHFQKTDKGDLGRHKQRIVDDNKRMVMGGNK